MKKYRWQIVFGVSLVALSALVYFLHFLVFGDVHHIVIYLVGDIAFVPIEVLLVTLILHQLLTRHEKRSLLDKMNMVIGAFFSEVGTDLLATLSRFDERAGSIRDDLIPRSDWSDAQFAAVGRSLRAHAGTISLDRGELAELRDFLRERRPFLLRLLENPNLLEHDSFTDLLWGVFHLTEELVSRSDLGALPETDREHLAGDIRRAYGLVMTEWLDYMQHLKKSYPYLFSLAIRTNPFDSDARVEVTQ